jgi:hypothetical protein
MKRRFQLRVEQFLSTRVIHPLLTPAFTKLSREFKPIPGLGWRAVPRASKKLTEEELGAIRDGRKKFDFGEYVEDQCYWFLNKAGQEQREQFFGHGGMTIVYLKPDPKAQPPTLPISSSRLRASSVYGAIFSKLDLDQSIAEAYSLQDSFLAKSRELFAATNPSDPRSQEAQFAVPLLSSNDFFSWPQACNQWFQLFDVYLTEDPEDQGVLVAAKHDIEEDLICVVEQMKNDGMQYPER